MPLLSVPEAKARVDAALAAIGPLPPEEVPLEVALAEGRVLRRAVEADADSPPFDRSAMDGYAVAAGGWEGPFRVVGAVRAGEVFPGPALRPGTCARIFTGAAVPEGAARVVMQEEARAEGGEVVFAEAALREGAPSFIRRRGEEYRLGARLVEEGTRLGPAEAGVLAMTGIARPLVSPRPRVAHIVTGSELVPVGDLPGAGQIRDSNSVLVAGLVAAAGGRMTRQTRVGDALEALRREVAAALDEGADLLLLSGGAGAGETDFGRRALEEAGFAVDFAGVSVRPGKPLLFARRGRTAAFCLPGNPLSHYVVFQLFVRRVLLGLQAGRQEEAERWDWIAWDGEPLDRGGGGRETYHPCRWGIVSGRVEARVLQWTSSGHLLSLIGANGMLASGGEGAPLFAGIPGVRLVRWS